MWRWFKWVGALLFILAVPPLAQAQQANVYWQCLPSGLNRFCTVSTANPMPVTATFSPSGTQDINIAQILGAAPSLTNPLWVTPATGASFVVTNLGSPFQAGGSIGNTTFGATLPATPLIASGNGVVITPTTEAASAVAPTTAVAAAESCRVLQASAANVYKVTVGIAATSGYVMIFNATSAPTDGAVSPAWPAIRIVSDGTSGWADIPFNPPLRLGTGATVCFSSTGPFTKTASATAAIGGLVK